MRPVVLRSKITEGSVLRSFSYVKRSWDFFSLFRNSDRQAGYLLSTSLAGTFHRRRPLLLKTGFFRQVRELKNPGSALCLKKNMLRYMLFEGGVKEQKSIHYQLQKNLSYVYVCMCVCVYSNCRCCLCDGIWIVADADVVVLIADDVLVVAADDVCLFKLLIIVVVVADCTFCCVFEVVEYVMKVAVFLT
jgi:hypothetical protein